ncbi:MAG: dTMP kinase [Bacilli bacterium]
MVNSTRGTFITIEGPEGAGKTSVIVKIKAFLEGLGYEVVTTREPGGIAISESIREIILDSKNTGMDARTEALLYAAARRQHLVEKVIPALNAGKIVLCDRFVHSSYVYQGIARGLGVEEIKQLNDFAIEDCYPDAVFLLDLPAEIGLSRIHKHRTNEINRFDLEDIAFHNSVREGYLQLLKTERNMIKVNANQPLEIVEQELLQNVEALLKDAGGTKK